MTTNEGDPVQVGNQAGDQNDQKTAFYFEYQVGEIPDSFPKKRSDDPMRPSLLEFT